VISVTAGYDSNDSTSAAVAVPDYLAEIEKPVPGLRIGVPEDYFGAGLDPEVKTKVQAGISLLEKLGCKRVPLKMPHTDYAIATYYIVATAEASSNLARYDGVRYGLRVQGNTLMEMYRKTRERGFGPEVKRRIMLGTYALSSGYYDAYYLRAQKVRSLIARDFASAFEKVDAIVTPTTPTAAFKLGEKTADPLQMYLADIYTVTGSLAGVPGISVPCGKTATGLPIGMQIFGSHFDEARILQLARAFEKAGGFSI
jgi:aspartyl-tRNA(Asn)/glutamyl-tRNA(Gln) amidotransferase subunit A